MAKRIQAFISKNKVHFIAWFFFILYEITVIGITFDEFAKFGNYLLHYIFNICFFYFHAHVTLKYTLGDSRLNYWILPLTIALEICLYIVLLFAMNTVAADYYGVTGIKPVLFNKPFLLKSSWRALYFIGFSTGYYFLVTYLKEKERTTELEKQRLYQIIERQKVEQELGDAQNAYLRAQINPHFLFNTLNFIYNRTRKSAPIAADAILTLSEMMRYAVDSNEEKGFIAIEEEITQVHHLIHLHKLRQNELLYFHVEVEPQVGVIKIIPLILITLVENVFKHGNLSLEQHPASLKIYTRNGTLLIETDNRINAIHNATGLNKGLENIEKRLLHSYGDQAKFTYSTDNKQHFKTQVRIMLNAVHFFSSSIDISDNIDK